MIVNNANSGVLGTGTVAMGAGTTMDLNGNSQTTGLLKTYDDASAITITSNAAGGTPVLTLSGTGTETFGGVISNGLATSIGIIKAGTGVQTFSGNNTYTGATQVNGGLLRITGRLGNTAVTVATTGALGGNGSIGGLVSLTGAGSAINLQDGQSGTLTLAAGLSLSGGSVLSFDLGTTGDQVALTGGTYTFTSGVATINLVNIAGYGAGSYQLITGASGISASNFELSAASLGGFNLSLSVTGGNTLTLNVFTSTSPAAAYWKGDVSGVWTVLSGGNSNFTSDAAGTTDPGQALDGTSAVIFSATGAANESSTTLGADISIKSLTINSASAVGIGGANVLTIVDPAGITINSGAGALTLSAQGVALGANQTWTNNSANAAVISSIISGARTLTLAGTGTFTLSGSSTFSGGLTLSAGTTLNINQGGTGAGSSALGTGTFTINGGTINNTSGGAVTVGTDNAMVWNANFAYGGTNDLNLGTGSVTLSATRTVTTNGSGTERGRGDQRRGFRSGEERDGNPQPLRAEHLHRYLSVSEGTLRLLGAVNALNTANIGQVTVGDTANLNAILNIEGGTLNATKNTSPSIAVGSVANSRGFVKMSSGSITTTSEIHLGRGAGAFAAMSMSGGTVTSGSWMVVGFNNDRAIFNQTAGDVFVNSNRMTIGAGGTGSIGVYNLSGSATFSALSGSGGMFVGENGVGVLNLSGSAAVNLATNGLAWGRPGRHPTARSTSLEEPSRPTG